MRDITKHSEYFNLNFRFPNEIFKSIPYCKIHKISNYGRIIRIETKYYVVNDNPILGYYKYKKPKIRKPFLGKDGYYFIKLHEPIPIKTLKIHVLVLETFNCLRPYKKCCNHKDGIKTNNNINNLEWVTYSENVKHAWANGLNKSGGKLKPEQVRFIRIAVKNKLYRQTELAEKYEVHPCTIGDIVHYRNWKNI